MTAGWWGAPGAWPSDVLPYGVVTDGRRPPRPAVAIGDQALDLAGLARAGLLDGALGAPVAVLDRPTLDGLLPEGPAVWRSIRARLRELLTDPGARDRVEPHLDPLTAVTPRLAWTVADYVDFYSSLDHATNVGRMFRPDEDPLTRAWRHLPIGYHGRAGTVVVSGTDIVRPRGLYAAPGTSAPAYGPSQQLDAEVEVGFVVGVGSPLGTTVPTERFADHVFGLVLVNDWSARDLQAFEYRPLGPFLGKSFATSVAPWIVPLDALTAAAVPAPRQEPPPSPHLAPAGSGYELALELEVAGTVVARPPFAGMYWTPAQQLAHLTSNGASLRAGDLFASGTVSGPQPDERGCLLELSRAGTAPIALSDGRLRSWLEDGDEVVIRGTARGSDGQRVPLGEVAGTVRPARPGGARTAAEATVG